MKYYVINKVFDIAKNPKYDGHQRGLASMVYKVFDEKSTWLADKSASKTIKGTGISSKIKQWAKGLLKLIIRKFEIYEKNIQLL